MTTPRGIDQALAAAAAATDAQMAARAAAVNAASVATLTAGDDIAQPASPADGSVAP